MTRKDALATRAGLYHPVSYAMAEAAVVLGLRHGIDPDELRWRITARADTAGCRTRFYTAVFAHDDGIDPNRMPTSAELTATLERLGCTEAEMDAPGGVFGITFPISDAPFSRHDRLRLAAVAFDPGRARPVRQASEQPPKPTRPGDPP